MNMYNRILGATQHDCVDFLWRVARLAAPDAPWEATPSGCLLLQKDGERAVTVDWNTVVGGSAVLGVVGGLRSWHCTIPSSFTDDEVREELSDLRVQLEQYLDANTTAFSQIVRTRMRIAHRAHEALWGSERSPGKEPRPPGHTCPQIDRAQSALRRMAWRAKRGTVLGVKERAAVDTILAEGVKALEAVRAENAQMRAAYWAVKRNISPDPTKEVP